MRKQKVIYVSAMLLLAAQIGCQKKPSLSSEPAKVSYAIGQGIAKNLMTQGVQLDPEVVGFAVTQTLKGEKPSISEDELQKAVAGLQQAMQSNAAAEATKNKSVAAEFMAKNKSKPGIKSTASGLQYQVLKEGKGKKPSAKDNVTVHYTGTLINGQKFDSSHDRGQPTEFPLPAVIKGWQEALQMMPQGSVFRIYIPPELAYGEQNKPGIPPNSVLVFEVELIKVGKGS